MKNFIKRIEVAASGFCAADYALFKIYMVAVGVLVGAYFAEFFLAHIAWVWVVAAVAGTYVCGRLMWLARR